MIVTKSFNARAQLDLIDMVANHVQGYRYIMVYYDHFTKFVQVRALKKKTACEVAEKLFDIFVIFGAPILLHTDNGREFKNTLMVELCNFFPNIKIIHGRPRNSQSQGGVERANQDVEGMLATWQYDNPTLPWTLGIKFVQMMKNQAYCDPIKMSPFEAVFSETMKNGLNSTVVPRELFSKIYDESDLINFELIEIEPAEECDNVVEGEISVDEDLADGRPAGREPKEECVNENQALEQGEMSDDEVPDIEEGKDGPDDFPNVQAWIAHHEKKGKKREYDLEAESIMRLKKSKETGSSSSESPHTIEIPEKIENFDNMIQGVVAAYKQRADLKRTEEVQNIDHITFESEVIRASENAVIGNSQTVESGVGIEIVVSIFKTQSSLHFF